jgi:hypothetical protein
VRGRTFGRMRSKARWLAVQRIGLRGGPSTITLNSSNTDLWKRKPLLFLLPIRTATQWWLSPFQREG